MKNHNERGSRGDRPTSEMKRSRENFNSKSRQYDLGSRIEHTNPSDRGFSETNSAAEAKVSYRRHTVLLIHDESFDEFDPRRFNSQFNVHCFKADSYSYMLKKSKKLNNTIKRLRPECIYIHTGGNDFLKKKSSLVSNVKELYEHLLKTTEAQICFSALIPSSNNSSINERIHVVNEETRNHVSWLHKHRPDVKDRIFTFSNDKIGDQNSYSFNTGFELRQRGQKMLWLRLREGLRKTLRLPRISYHDNNKTRRSTNRFSND